MDLIIEDGTGKTDANTYIDVSFVDSFCSALGYSSWALTTATKKKAAILRSMAYSESLMFAGYKNAKSNSLSWPRRWVKDKDGYCIDSNVIPYALKQAVAYGAYEESLESGILQMPITHDDRVTESKIGPITTKWAEGVSVMTKFTQLRSYLRGLVIPFNVRRTVRY